MTAAPVEDPSTPGPGRFVYGADETPLEGYRIVRPIHRGGFGEVYEAVSDGGKKVALKLLHTHTDIELRGARKCLNLDHPNLVTIYDIRRDGRGDWWIVMEYVPGERLSDVLDRGAMTPAEAVRWVDGIAAAIDHLHARGLVHRDLKPANVFERDGVVKLGDVGLAKFVRESKRSGHTRSVGTVHYMAPEVGRGNYGPQVDVYALGVLLAEMLTGRPPFDGESVAEILMRHLTEEPDLSGVEPRFRAIIAAALEKDPAKRTPSAGRLCEDFVAATGGARSAGATSTAGLAGRVADEIRSVGRTFEDLDRRASSALRGHRGRRTGQHEAPARDEADRPERGLGSGLFLAAWITTMVVCFASPQLLGLSRPAGIAGGVFLAIALAVVDDKKGRRKRRRKAERRETRRRTEVSRPVEIGPDTLRTVGLRQRFADAIGGSAVATLLSGLFAFAGLAVAKELDGPVAFALLTTTTAFAASTFIAISKLLEGTSVRPRRLAAAVAGVAAGVFAGGAARAIAGAPIVDLDGGFADIDGDPYVVGPVLFLGLLACIPPWYRLVDAYRPKRFRVWPVLYVGAIGFVLTHILGDPEPAPIAWAFLLPVVTQLAAPWTPPVERIERTEVA